MMMKIYDNEVGKDHDKLYVDLDDDEDCVWSSQPTCRMWTKACLKTLASSDDDDGDSRMLMMMFIIRWWILQSMGPK